MPTWRSWKSRSGRSSHRSAAAPRWRHRAGSGRSKRSRRQASATESWRSEPTVMAMRPNTDSKSADRALVAPRRQMHEGEMPEEMVAEVAEMVARMDARRQRLHAAVVLARLVEHVGHRVHRPCILRVHGHRALGQGHGLAEAAVLLQAEGVQPQHVGVALECPPRRLGELEHLRRAPLPEVDEVETLQQQHVARVLDEQLLDEGDGVVAAPGHPERERLHVTALPGGERGAFAVSTARSISARPSGICSSR